MIDITDANIYDAISTFVPKSFNQQVATISLKLTFYPCLGFNEFVDNGFLSLKSVQCSTFCSTFFKINQDLCSRNGSSSRLVQLKHEPILNIISDYQFVDIILPSNVATWVNVRFIANIGELKSGTSQTS